MNLRDQSVARCETRSKSPHKAIQALYGSSWRPLCLNPAGTRADSVGKMFTSLESERRLEGPLLCAANVDIFLIFHTVAASYPSSSEDNGSQSFRQRRNNIKVVRRECTRCVLSTPFLLHPYPDDEMINHHAWHKEDQTLPAARLVIEKRGTQDIPKRYTGTDTRQR